jgi:hypothetical protein
MESRVKIKKNFDIFWKITFCLKMRLKGVFFPVPYVYETLFCRLKFFVLQLIEKFTIFLGSRVKVEENFDIFWKITFCLKVHIKVDFFDALCLWNICHSIEIGCNQAFDIRSGLQ